MNALDRPGCRPDLLTVEILERAVVTPCGTVYNAVMGGRQCRGGARCEFGSKRLFKAIDQGTHAFCSLYYLAESTPAEELTENVSQMARQQRISVIRITRMTYALW